MTLPKEWARRLGLKPGVQVMLIDEGDSIRVKPIEGNYGESVYLDLRRISSDLAKSVPLCIYMSPLNGAFVRFPDHQSLQEAKKYNMSLLGIQIYEEPSNHGFGKIDILLDTKRIDLPKLFQESSSIGQRYDRASEEGYTRRWTQYIG